MTRLPRLLRSAVLSLLLIACKAYDSREARSERLLDDSMSMPLSGEDAMSMHMSAKGKGKTGSSVSSKGKSKGKGGKGSADEYMDMHFSIEMSMPGKGHKSSKKSSKSAKSSKKGAGMGNPDDDTENNDDIIGK